MPFNIGTKVGPYEITGQLGVGGMGEVYRATDSRLRRDVAIKFSAEQFSERFEREARAVAALNHPNICTLYDVGSNYLVMELVEGTTLADRIKEGPIPLEDALAIGRQITAALEAAHEKEVVHRDLKPANIKIKPDGTVKVLDFGLARLGPAAGVSSDDSPTFTIGATRAGVILGTAGYMSPEQARGKAMDKRTDIWAFGVVFFEMLTGERLFKGEDVSETLAAVIKEQPSLERAPSQVQRLLQSCLEKNPQNRLRDIGDVWRLLESSATPTPAPVARAPQPWFALGVAAMFFLAAAAMAVLYFRRAPASTPEVVRFYVALPEKGTFGRSVSISPDGRRLIFRATTDGVPRLWIRELGSLELRSLPGTEGAFGYGFWSPDSRFIVFGLAGKLKKIEASGGPATTLCDLPDALAGGFWTNDNRIIFGTDSRSGLLEVSAEGGPSAAITAFDAQRDRSHSFPVLLPDAQHFIYVRRSNRPEDSGIYVGELNRGPGQQSSKRLMADVSMPLFAPSLDSRTPNESHILFARENTLMARRFEPSRLEFSGDAVAITADPNTRGTEGTYSVSANGVLVYTRGGTEHQLQWYDRQGRVTGTIDAPSSYWTISLSPDATRAALMMALPEPNIWVFDLARNISTRLTSLPGTTPVWSADGNRIMFNSRTSGVFVKTASGAGAETVVLQEGQGNLWDWSTDGRHLLYQVDNAKTKSTDLWTLTDPEGPPANRKSAPYLNGDSNEGAARFSPDGRFVAYVSNESGANAVYVRPFPDANAGKWPISNGPGFQPRWRRDGKELVYLSGDGTLMSVDIASNPSFTAGIPKVLFRTATWALSAPNSTWDMTPDGQRFLVITTPEGASASLVVELNWQAGLRK
jgi:Tol biopolymer transport system component